jgi:hypothetical protein
MENPTTSIRESLEAAISSAPEAPASPSIESTPSAPAPEPAGLDAQVSSDSAPDTQSLDAGTQDLNALAEDQRESGTEQQKAESKEITPGPKSAPKTNRAPASWRPEVREHWAKLPDSVRAEVARREAEVTRTLQETVELRRNAEQFAKVLAPYEAYIKAENATPAQAIDNLMATAVKLRTSTGPELAQMMAGLVKQYGTGRFGNQFVEMLDSALAGQSPQVDPMQSHLQQAIQQQLAPVQQFMSQMQMAQEQQRAATVQKAESEVSQFLDQAEFANDVRDDMADILEVAQRRGVEMTLQQAYQKACLVNDRVRSVLAQRAKMQGAQVQTNAAQRARSAAVSVPSSGPSMGAPNRLQPDNIRDAIEAAIAMNSR